MGKLGVFSAILVCVSLAFMALGLTLASCNNPAGSAPPAFTVTFNANGGGGAVPNPITLQTGSRTALPGGNGLSRSGYTFGGWNTNAAGTGTNYNAGSSYTPESDSTLYARWVTAYTVTFNANGGNGAAPSPITVNAGSRVTLPNGSGLTKTGYTFGGWSTSASGYSVGTSFTPAGNTILYAKWDAVAVTPYTVTFNANSGNGAVPGPITVNAGSSVTLPGGSGLTIRGFTFGGWNTNVFGTGTNYSAGDSFEPTGNITLHAKWDAVVVTSYTVSFNANGGNGTVPGPITVSAGSSVTLPSGSGLTKSGFTFGGWNTNADGAGINYSAGASYAVTGNITLYARWIAAGTAHYTVTFNVNGGSGTTPAVQTAVSGSSITLPGGDGLTMSGLTFGGWNTNSSGTGTNYSAGESFTPTGNTTLYARWITNYTVTFSANSGSGTVPTAQSVPPGSSITLPNGDGLSRIGYAFGGWNTNSSGTGTNYSVGESFTPAAHITLHASWDAVTYYTVSFNINGGNGIAPNSQTVQEGSGITLPNESGLTKTGYALGGWYKETALTNQWDFDTGAVTGDITLYAKWNPVAYTIIYDKNAADATGTMTNSSHTYDVDKNLNTNAFTRTGYTFDGWARTTTGAVEFTDGASIKNLTSTAGGTITLYAKWTPITYSVAYNKNATDATGTMTNSSHTYDVAKALNANAFVRNGYTFDGWARTSTGAVEFTNGQGAKNLTAVAEETITLYAVWVETSTVWTVRFETSGGSPVGDAIVLRNTPVSRPAPDPTRTGYTFDGWYANPELTTPYNFSSIVIRDITLYARWYSTVTFNANSATTGTAPASQTANAGSSITIPGAGNLAKTGYTFDGWNTNTSGTGTNYNAGASYTPAGNITLYAKWTPNTAGITFDMKQIVDGAPIIAAITISRTNSGYPVTFPVSVNASDYDTGSIKWEVAGVGAYAGQTVTGSGASFTLNAAEVKYNSLGGHALILTVTKGGTQYQRAILFTIVR